MTVTAIATIAPLLEKATAAKNALLEATDVLHELDELLLAHPKLAGKPHGLIRSALASERKADELALEALKESMHFLACLEQAFRGDEGAETLYCLACGSTVRITRRLAAKVEKALCVACHGDLSTVKP